MPAIISHHIFGEQALNKTNVSFADSEEAVLAFLLANQGPDPLFARFSTGLEKMRSAHKLAHLMHEEHMTACFSSLKRSAGRFTGEDGVIASAFALGFFGHWLLDATAHPFIYAQQYRICAADLELAKSPGEVHAVLESDIDSWLLWQTRHASVLEYPPADELGRTERIGRIASAMLAQAALEVFGISLGADEYAAAVRDFELMYRLIEPAGSARNQAIARLEELFRENSRLLAQAHRIKEDDICPSANLDHQIWTDPDTAEVRTESFADLFDAALQQWNEASRIFLQGSEDELRSFIAGRNYNGVRVSDD